MVELELVEDECHVLDRPILVQPRQLRALGGPLAIFLSRFSKILVFAPPPLKTVIKPH